MLFWMELIAAAFVIIGVVWIIARVGLRPGAGSVQLPPVVDNSIGMWGVRELRARMLGADPDASPSAGVVPVIIPQPFNAETARRLGIPRAMDLIDPSASAKSAARGRSKKAGTAGGPGGVAAVTTASSAAGSSASRVAAATAAPATIVQRPMPAPGGAASTTTGAVVAAEASGRRLSGVALAAMIAAAVLAGVLIGAAMAVIAPPSPGVVAGTGASVAPSIIDPSGSPGS